MDNNRLIIIALLVIIITLLSMLVLMPVVKNTDVQLEQAHFNFLSISVPEESDFSIEVDHGTNMAITNKGGHAKEAFAILTKSKDAELKDGEYIFQNTTGDINIYKHKNGDEYRVDKVVGDYKVVIRGTDLNLIIKMLNTARCS